MVPVAGVHVAGCNMGPAEVAGEAAVDAFGALPEVWGNASLGTNGCPVSLQG